MKRLEIERSVTSRKAIVYTLGALMRRGESINVITSLMNRIIADEKEDYRVSNEAKLVIEYGYIGSPAKPV